MTRIDKLLPYRQVQNVTKKLKADRDATSREMKRSETGIKTPQSLQINVTNAILPPIMTRTQRLQHGISTG
jgi:hypothetical protein